MDEFTRLFGSETRKREYLRYMRERIEEKGFTVEETTMATPTGESKCWRLISDEGTVYPMLNPDNIYYSAGDIPIDDIVDRIIKEVKTRIDQTSALTLDSAKDDVRIMLRNPRLNENYLNQINAVMFPLGDLAIIPYFITDIGASIPNRAILDKWGD